MSVSIWNGGRKVGDSAEIQSLHLDVSDDPDYPDIKSVYLHYLPQVQMVPTILFEHLAGRALMAFLDGADMKFVVRDEETEKLPIPDCMRNVRYIHGRSEVMKGTPSVSAVLLGRFQMEGGAQLSLATLVVVQPKLWTRYLQLHGSSLEA